MIEEILAIGISVLLICLIIIGCVWGYRGEKKAFNEGYCPKCYGRLEHFDVDSQGGHGYSCENGDYTTWVSYPHIIEE